MKLSLLDIVQRTLSALDSDPVNSIDETVEAYQVSELVRDCYMEFMASREWPHLRTMFSFEGLQNTSRPWELKIPEDVDKVYWIRYAGKQTTYCSPQEFKEHTQSMSDRSMRNPTYWTSYNDQTIEFDSYNATEESTLTESKSEGYGLKVPEWQHADDFVPDMPAKFFPTLLAEVKAQAFVNLKQSQNPREERKAQRGRTVLRNEAWKIEQGEARYDRKVNYGRK